MSDDRTNDQGDKQGQGGNDRQGEQKPQPTR